MRQEGEKSRLGAARELGGQGQTRAAQAAGLDRSREGKALGMLLYICTCGKSE